MLPARPRLSPLVRELRLLFSSRGPLDTRTQWYQRGDRFAIDRAQSEPNCNTHGDYVEQMRSKEHNGWIMSVGSVQK